MLKCASAQAIKKAASSAAWPEVKEALADVKRELSINKVENGDGVCTTTPILILILTVISHCPWPEAHPLTHVGGQKRRSTLLKIGQKQPIVHI